MPRPRLLFAVFLTWFTAASDKNCGAVDFEADVLPVLAKRCIECHNARDNLGELDLSSHRGLLDGGESGNVVDTASPLESQILLRVQAGEMPP